MKYFPIIKNFCLLDAEETPVLWSEKAASPRILTDGMDFNYIMYRSVCGWHLATIIMQTSKRNMDINNTAPSLKRNTSKLKSNLLTKETFDDFGHPY